MKPFFVRAGKQLINMNLLLHFETDCYTDGRRRVHFYYQGREKPVSFDVSQGWLEEYFENVKSELEKRNV